MIAALIVGYVFITWIGLAVYKGVTSTKQGSLVDDYGDVPELLWAMFFSLLWPIAAVGMIVAGAFWLPYKGIDLIYRGSRWTKREITNPKENIPSNSEEIASVEEEIEEIASWPNYPSRPRKPTQKLNMEEELTKYIMKVKEETIT